MLLYDQLVALCDKNDAFYYKDVERDRVTYRLFSYRSPSYRDFCEPGAIECRGIMFEIDSNKRPIRVACRPMEKFFNLGENPFTLNLDLTKVDRIMTKVDGSLISTFLAPFGDRLVLDVKSKASLSSVQALEAKEWMRQDAQIDLRIALAELTASSHTVNMEWTAPNNRIVLKYQEPRLTILNIRHNVTGDYLKRKVAIKAFPILEKYWVDGKCTDRMTAEERASYEPEAIKKMVDIEGFIYVMDNGQMVKVKTDWYMNIHRAKDQALNFRYVLEAVINERADDLRSILVDDPVALKLLNRVENTVKPWYNSAIARTERFYEANKSLPRKDYAIKAYKEAGDIHHLVMSLYLGREADYPTYALKQYDQLKSMCGVEGFNGLQDD